MGQREGSQTRRRRSPEQPEPKLGLDLRQVAGVRVPQDSECDVVLPDVRLVGVGCGVLQGGLGEEGGEEEVPLVREPDAAGGGGRDLVGCRLHSTGQETSDSIFFDN